MTTIKVKHYGDNTPDGGILRGIHSVRRRALSFGKKDGI